MPTSTPAPENVNPTPSPEATPANTKTEQKPAPTETAEQKNEQETEARKGEQEAAERKNEQAETPEAVKPAATAPVTATETVAARAEGGGTCALTVGEGVLSLKASGSPVILTARLEGGGDPLKIKATTLNWADIVIFAEPRREDDAGAQRFAVSSISGKVGSYTITVNSPCGKSEVQVEVK